ncbi:phosphonoacetaldehyde hydrolase [Thalassomonas viridans]|uniref:Phosphonoacetaldehyde hydrolase n=1 Tax=Thalassomonas viridans TaxID=137584 RepID=A0AAE9Z2Y4_9GAMM|nr:phosphonoacetaldehyde hydrolase [Thalassomonas viridans]WDE05650.1 phosphonoacetaldehyde hydrolase [Thalassomonas viridans]
MQNILIEALILDWAGTVVDYGSVAPTSIFVEAFKKAYNFEISMDEARVPMGMGKWDHIRALGKLPSVRGRWLEQFGHAMTNEQIDEIYNTFMPLQKAKVAERAQPIPDVMPVLNSLKNQGIKLGSCSGYPREVMEVLVPAAAAYGYKPDCYVCSDDLAARSRPGPWMALQNVIELGIKSVFNCVKVDDSTPGIEEGINAGMWTVGLALTGNAVGTTQEEWQALSGNEQQALRSKAVEELTCAGAHFVIDSLAMIEPVLQEINNRLIAGERP